MDTSAKGKTLWFDGQYLVVELEDHRLISTPLDWYPELRDSDAKTRGDWKFICRKTGIEWPKIDYHLSIESMLLGVPIRVQHAVMS